MKNRRNVSASIHRRLLNKAKAENRSFNELAQYFASESIHRTFETRKTEIPKEVEAFTDRFIESKQIQWIAFYKRLKNDHVPADFKEIVYRIRDFLTPVIP